MSLNRVVITGCGVVSPLGYSVRELLRGLEANASATQTITTWNRYGKLRCQVGALVEVRDAKAIPRQFRRTMSRMSIFATQAAGEALTQAKIDEGWVAQDPGVGCVMGSTTGSPDAITTFYETLLRGGDYSLTGGPEFFRCVGHTVAMNVAQFYGLRGTVLGTSAACASGLQALAVGYDLIRLGRQTVMLCGGSEELHETTVGSFDVLFAASTGYNQQPQQTPRPFDARRDGLVCGEGAGVAVLESRPHALARGATILAEVLGYHSCNNGTHVSKSDAPAMAHCMRTALCDAHLTPQDIGYVNAHATGTLQGDEAEARAIAEVFSDGPPVSSLKGHLGHTLAGSGVIELAACIDMMHRGMIYPTRNLEEIDPKCAGPRLIQSPMPLRFDAFLKNSFAFGGINVAVICGRHTP